MERLEPRLVLSTNPLITEFMASNDATLQDFSGDFPDWIEVHNPTTSPLDLAGWYLTDTRANLSRWQFPNQPESVLDSGEYLIIFASSKDGDPGIPAGELHTNFSLNAGGEYLGLVKPDGVTIVHEYAPLYPEQITDISFGAGGAIEISDAFVGDGAGAAILVPADGSLGTTWTGGQPFDDSTWQEGAIGVGYDTEGGTPWLYSLIDVGLLGQRLEPGAVGVASSGNGVNLPTTQLESETGDSFTIAIDNVNGGGSSVGGLDWRDRGDGSNDSLVALGEDHVKNNQGIVRLTLGSLPDGVYSVTSYHTDVDFDQSEAIRIFVTDAVSTLVEQAVTASADINVGGAGGLTTSEVISTSATFTIVSGGASDVIVLFDGTQANDTEVPLSGLQIERLGGAYEGLIETDLETAMYDQSGSAYLRIPFDIADPSILASLSLDIHYDDGFVAYLNGVKIAERNAPALPTFDSIASASHPDAEALIPEKIDVSAHLGDLVAGENILAIHGLNSSSTSSDFLILPLLTGTRTVTSPATYYTTPTPGAVNVPGVMGIVADTRFSVDRGFFATPFSVEITTDTAEAEIRYTLDGSTPTATTGTIYTEPIDISSTSVLRAAAFKPGYLPTNVDTQTYLFLDDVLQQNEAFGIDGSGLPPFAAWGHAGEDWEVDPQITGHADPDNRLTVDKLRAVPTISLVLPWEEMFGGGGQGIYISGSGSPRGTSVELIQADGSTGFQVDGSVQIQGGTSDNRWKSDKLSMRVKFTEVFGPTKLNYPLFGAEATDRFDTFILDATLNHSWTHPGTDQTDTAKFIQDQFVANIQNAMGSYAPHARYHHLYINGLYWGMYYVHERPDESFAAAYLGGDKDDYDVLKHTSGTVVNGSSANFNSMLNLARQNLANDGNFQNLAGVLDIDDFIDYMLVNFYAGNEDWDHHNWYATFNRVDPNGRWRFHSWDAEHVLESINRNVTGEDNSGRPSEIHQNLTANAEYRMMFADHVQRHFFNGGVLTSENAAAAYQQLMDEIDQAIVGESARWGDNRVSSPYTRDDWLGVQNDLLDNYFPQRTSRVLSQLRSRNLFPIVDAPAFNQHGGHVLSGFDLTISAPAGVIYYTLDGSDPREIGGGISASAIPYVGSPIDITAALTVKTRALAGSEWSALTEAAFIVASPADATNLRITELNYNPHAANPVPGLGELDLDSDQFEFVELQNVGNETIDLSGVQFVEVVDGADLEGIVFTFSQQTVDSGEYVLVVKNQAAFESRYGTGLNIAGEYSGQLSNAGEQITLLDAFGEEIQSFEYADSGNWPERSDGEGSSLEVNDTAGDYNSADNWRNSNEFGGSPAAVGTGPVHDVVVNEILSHSGGGAPDLIELYNTTNAPIDLSKWYLSDASGNLFRFQVPVGTMISEDQYLVFDETQLGFGLDGHFGDDVWLVAADNATGEPRRFADQHRFDATDTDVSLGRWPNGDPSGTLFPMTAQTFGGANSGPLFGDLLITEIHYNPADVPPEEQGNIAREELEFIELYNHSGDPLDISHWSVEGIGFTFSPGTTVAAGEAIVVVTFDPVTEPIKAAAFRNVFSINASARLFGAASGQLNNAGESVKLLRPEDPQTLLTGNVLVDTAHYDDLAPWPSEADGGGQSLVRTAPTDFAPLATSWTAQTPTPGSVAFVPTTPGDFNRDGHVDGDDFLIWQTGFGTTSGASWSDGDSDEDGDVDGDDFLNWQQNFGDDLASGSAANSSASAGANATGRAFFSTAPVVTDSLNHATTRSRGTAFARDSSLYALGSVADRHSVLFEAVNFAGRSSPRRTSTSNGYTTTWPDQLQSQEARRRSRERELAIDTVMSRKMTSDSVLRIWGIF